MELRRTNRMLEITGMGLVLAGFGAILMTYFGLVSAEAATLAAGIGIGAGLGVLVIVWGPVG